MGNRSSSDDPLPDLESDFHAEDQVSRVMLSIRQVD
jgi:hypothetical protein